MSDVIQIKCKNNKIYYSFEYEIFCNFFHLKNGKLICVI